MSSMDQVGESVQQQMNRIYQAVLKELQNLFDYFSKLFEKKFDAQQEMLKYLKKNGRSSLYDIPPSLLPEVRAELNARKIPYIPLESVNKDKTQLIIRFPDEKIVDEITRKILIARGNYFQEVNNVEFENVMATSPNVSNRNIITVHGLTPYQADELKNKCNNISKGFMIGVEERDDGKVDISCSENHLYSKDRKDFCRAYVQEMIAMNGPLVQMKLEMRDANLRVEDEIGKLAHDEGTQYVVSSSRANRMTYIELNKTGFEVHECHQDPDDPSKIINEQTRTVLKTEKNYDLELQRETDKIWGKVIVNDGEELFKYLQNDKETAEHIKEQYPSFDETTWRKAEAQIKLVNQIDKMVKKKLGDMEEKTPEEKFEAYKSEYVTVLSYHMGISDRKEKLEGYSKEDMNDLERIYEENQDLNPDEYQLALEVIKNSELECHAARAKEKEEIKAARESDRGGIGASYREQTDTIERTK